MKYSLIPTLMLLVAGCSAPPEKTATPTPEAAPVPVSVHTVSVTGSPAVREITGTVAARMKAAAAARVMGYVREVRASVGDRVNTGQPLVILDARDLEAAVQQARAGVTAAEEGRAEAESALRAAQTQLALAEKTFRRFEDLHNKKSVSDQELDEARARYEAARASREMAASRKNQLEARIQQAREGLESARVMASYSTVSAPFAGVVTERVAEPGMLATPGQPLLTVERAGSYRIEAQVEESLLGQLRQGQPVQVKIDSLGRDLQLRISEILPSVDPGSRSIQIRLNLPEMRELRSGMYARVLLPGPAASRLTVPAEALVESGQLRYVYTEQDGRASQRMVSVGARSGGQVEVLSGLREGDRVLLPADKLSDRARVEVR